MSEKFNTKVKCKNCIYAEFKKTEKGRVKTSVAGTCGYTIPMPKVPNSYVVGIHGPIDLNYYKCHIWANDDHECPCFIAKHSKK